VAVGGGAGQELWPKIVSSVIGRAQQLTRETVGAALGDAMLAAAAVGREPDLNQWNPVVRKVEPDPESSVVYQDLWPHYRELHRQTRAIQSVLAGFNMS
jgi:xylulokinase